MGAYIRCTFPTYIYTKRNSKYIKNDLSEMLFTKVTGAHVKIS
jgi:hypothetical protein